MNKIAVGDPFIRLEKTGSTNNYAMQQIAKGGVTEGTAWYADYQDQGRGQRGKSWMAKPGDNISLSVVLQPVMLRPSDTFALSALIALAAYDFFKTYAGVESCIKWSNDIYWCDKKAAGILIENMIRGSKWTYAVIGIGVNLNQESFSTELPNPVSLRQITGHKWDPQTLAKDLCRQIELRYNALNPAHLNTVIEEYESHLFRLHEPALFAMNDETFEGCIHGIEKDGRLILQRGAKLLRVGFGEVRFVV